MIENKLIPEACDVAIVGGGTSGLALAAHLKRLGIEDIIVLERDHEAGGIPRHCGHYPFGIKEYHKLMKGPDYARKNVDAAIRAQVNISTNTTVTAIHPGGRLSLATPTGTSEISAKRVVLCTGVRESSRAQRLLGGQRPAGVISTGALQSLVYLHNKRPFRRPIIFGSELVSLSAIMTCRHLGIKPVAMIEEDDRMRARIIMRLFPNIMGLPLFCGAKNLQIHGQSQVEAVEFQDDNNAQRTIECDGVIISGHFRPEASFVRLGHLEMDQNSGGPSIDQYGRCSDPTYYCTGNLLRPAETSSWCWHEGMETAVRIANDLAAPDKKPAQSVTLLADDDIFKFIIPQRISLTDEAGAMSNMQIGLKKPAKGKLEATCEGKILWSGCINSRPLRRVLTPLDSILNTKIDSSIKMTFRREK